MGFKTSLKVEKIGKNKWLLLAPLVFEGSAVVIVPAGFETDFASVPRAAWWFCSPAAGNHAKPSVLHDYLCETSSSQEFADKLFLEAMASNGVGRTKRHVMYWAVVAYQTKMGRYRTWKTKNE